VRPESATTRSQGEFAWHVGGDTGTIAAARHAFDAWLQGTPASAEERADLAVVISELASNAIEGASDGSGEIRATLRDGAVEVEATNRVADAAEDALRWDLDDPLRGGGRGLLIVRAYTDSMEVHSTADQVIVRCALRLADSA
jgi:anti-sigma regulatory factor (Ser/Thr protein kinase)